ncbi:hypothetical protein NOF04DRAFT_1282826 [Fusarium oxysporum II5]|nr:hypothetical protein NOF04DRAFT_1282826 [Fusarium oxysporum II5]
MASESPKATDLATMPNHPDPTSSTEAPAHATSSTTPDAVAQADVPTSPDVSSQKDQNSSEQNGAANAWPSHEDDDDDSNEWLASDGAVPNQTQEETALEETELEVASQPKAPVSQHSSSMSFARTVSHEISFGDEEEGEWNLSRTDTDPFKFMPPTDRTNSFPPVPPAHTNSEARTLLLDIYWGDLKSPEGQDSDERYEEGMPLIPPPEKENHEVPSEQPNHTLSDSFDDETVEGDDFFSQVQGSEPASDEKPAPALERKSTMQEEEDEEEEEEEEDDSSDDDEDSDEDSEEDKKAAQPAPTPASSDPAPAAPDSSPAKKEDLASKWEQAFADDEDDDFLLEENAGDDKQVDPSCLLWKR